MFLFVIFPSAKFNIFVCLLIINDFRSSFSSFKLFFFVFNNIFTFFIFLLTLTFIAFYYSMKVHSNIAFKITFFFGVFIAFECQLECYLIFLYSLNNYSLLNVRDMSAWEIYFLTSYWLFLFQFYLVCIYEIFSVYY